MGQNNSATLRLGLELPADDVVVHGADQQVRCLRLDHTLVGDRIDVAGERPPDFLDVVAFLIEGTRPAMVEASRESPREEQG